MWKETSSIVISAPLPHALRWDNVWQLDPFPTEKKKKKSHVHFSFNIFFTTWSHWSWLERHTLESIRDGGQVRPHIFRGPTQSSLILSKLPIIPTPTHQDGRRAVSSLKICSSWPYCPSHTTLILKVPPPQSVYRRVGGWKSVNSSTEKLSPCSPWFHRRKSKNLESNFYIPHDIAQHNLLQCWV